MCRPCGWLSLFKDPSLARGGDEHVTDILVAGALAGARV